MDDTRLRVALGANIKRRLKHLSLSQEKASELAGVSASHLAEIILGKKWPSDKVLCRLAEVLQLEPFELFLEEAHPRSLELDEMHKFQLEIKEGFDDLLREKFRRLYQEPEE